MAMDNKILEDKQARLFPIAEIEVRPGRGRRDFSHVPELAESIKVLGVICPITIEQDPENGRYFLIAGECRLRASILAGKTHIPVQLRSELSELQRLELELEENKKRKELKWSEEIDLTARIDRIKKTLYGEKSSGMKGEGWSQIDTAHALDVSPSKVSQDIQLSDILNARPDLKALVVGQNMPKKVARRLIDQIIKTEEVEDKVKRGVIRVSSNILHGSCLALIKDQPDSSIDCVITDPPFGNTEIATMEGADRGDVQSYSSLLKPTDNLDRSKVLELMGQLIPELYRVLKPSSHTYIFHSSDLFGDLVAFLQKAGFDVQLWPVIWNKGRTTAPFRGYDYSPCYEPVIFAHKPPKQKRLTEACKAILDFSPVPTGAGKIHPFQKPRELLAYLIKQSTLQGEIVLDPFCGSGSLIQACVDTGRSGIGYELDDMRFMMAQADLMQYQTVKKSA